MWLVVVLLVGWLVAGYCAGVVIVKNGLIVIFNVLFSSSSSAVVLSCTMVLHGYCSFVVISISLYFWWWSELFCLSFSGGFDCNSYPFAVW